MRFYYDGNKNRQTHKKRECFTWNILFATQISISSCKADIRNPSLQLCWQGLASLLAHERSRFAICQWELSTPTDISIPPHPPLSAPRTWSGGMLICVQMPPLFPWAIFRSHSLEDRLLAIALFANLFVFTVSQSASRMIYAVPFFYFLNCIMLM